MQCVLSPPFNVIRKPPYWGGGHGWLVLQCDRYGDDGGAGGHHHCCYGSWVLWQ